MRFLARAVALLALFCGAPSPLSAAVLLPGNILVSGRDQIVLIDPGRREPQVVSSPTVGSGVPYPTPTFEDFDLGIDGLLYAVDHGLESERVFRIDPATGDREVISSNTIGQGMRLFGVSAIEVARDGTIYVADTDTESQGAIIRIYSVDPATGDRALRVEARILLHLFSLSDLDELPDGRLAAAAMVGSTLGGNSIWIADPVRGTLVRSSQLFDGPAYSIAVPSSADRAFVVTNRFGVASRILVLPFNGGPAQIVADCERPGPPFSLRPFGLAMDPDGFLVVSASFTEEFCTAPGLRKLAGQVYRFDPATRARTLLYESEPVFNSASFTKVIIVPEDFPFDDADADSVADVLDNCASVINPGQADLDGDGIGDACNDAQDTDGDEIADLLDLCPGDPDPLQLDQDQDGVGDACDPFAADPNNAAAALEIELAQAQEDLAMCLAALPIDSDDDGRVDPDDLCPGTMSGEEVDGDGCSLQQFCARFDLDRRFRGIGHCMHADWRNDEPLGPQDCRVRSGHCAPRW